MSSAPLRRFRVYVPPALNPTAIATGVVTVTAASVDNIGGDLQFLDEDQLWVDSFARGAWLRCESMGEVES